MHSAAAVTAVLMETRVLFMVNS
jgi:hypothetical protein